MTVFAQTREPGPLPAAGRSGPPLVLAVHGSAAPAAVRTVARLCSRLGPWRGATRWWVTWTCRRPRWPSC
ncbi:hypothetical protein ACIA8O_33155 [Kitasatospora sp. NPDC051853]|uniref:hypothetical protein n=1 Tax=Kitasatospora sp. NPDC051853 TaxID=3364058 RepID=UPI0037A5A135